MGDARMKISMALGVPALLLSALIVGCGEKEEKKPAGGDTKTPEAIAPVKKAESGAEKSPGDVPEKKPAAAGDTKALTFGKGERKWTVQIPPGWKEEEVTKPLRLAQVRVPKAANDPEDA